MLKVIAMSMYILHVTVAVNEHHREAEGTDVQSVECDKPMQERSPGSLAYARSVHTCWPPVLCDSMSEYPVARGEAQHAPISGRVFGWEKRYKQTSRKNR